MTTEVPGQEVSFGLFLASSRARGPGLPSRDGPHLNTTALLKNGVTPGDRQGGVQVGCLDHAEASDDFFGFGERRRRLRQSWFRGSTAWSGHHHDEQGVSRGTAIAQWSRSARLSAVTSPHRRLANVVSSTSAR